MTNDSIRCPKCDHQLTQVGQFWVCPKHGQISIEKASSPLRIFLSFGHDNNEELACLIGKDLKKRGHDVWIDKCKIKGGDDWRRKITDGILHSQRVLSLLSKHSTREPGVCLDEIAIAIGAKGGNIQSILVESEEEVNPPASISHIQWLDMHDWKQQRNSGNEIWEKWYRGKLQEIIEVVESEESLRFAGEIKSLEDLLKPISSDSRVAYLLKKGFVGREWLVKSIDKWQNADENPSRLFWIIGAPGVGKSTFAAHLYHYGKDKIIAVQFCEYDKPDHRNALRIIRTLAFQIATRLPDYRKFLLNLPEIKDLEKKNSSELFDYLIVNPLRLVIDGGRERYLIVIDAIDEAGGGGGNELVEMLARNAPRLPDWIGIIVTSRPEFDVITPLQGLQPFTLDTKMESNRNDIRNYLRGELATFLKNRQDSELLIETILDKSEGVFLYAERFCEEVRLSPIFLDHPDHFPQGLGEIFFQYFRRQYPDEKIFQRDVQPALRIILAAFESLPVVYLQNIFNWNDEQLRNFIDHLSSLFPVTVENSTKIIKIYHKSLADWLMDERKAGPYYVDIMEGHMMLAAMGWSEYKKHGPKKLSYYSLNYLPFHLLKAKRYHDLVLILKDKDYFLLSWNNNEFQVKSLWSDIERSSELRIFEIYKDVISYPIKYPQEYLSCIATLLADTGYIQYSETIHSYLKFYYKLGFDKKNVQVANGNLGYIYLLKGKFNDALRLFENQEKYYRKLSDFKGLIIVLGNKGTALYKMDMLDEAFACYKEQEDLCVRTHDDDQLQMSIGNQGNIFFEYEQFDASMDSYKKQFTSCQKSGNLQGMCQSIGNQGNVSFKQAKYDEAYQYYRNCEKLCKKILYRDGEQRALGDQGKIFLQKGDFDKATDLFNEQEKICVAIKNQRARGECLRSKAQLLEEKEQFDKALELYFELKSFYQDSDDYYGVCDTLECIGLLYLKIGQLDFALNDFIELETFSNNHDIRKKNCVAITNQGLIHEARGEFDQALNCYEIAERKCNLITEKQSIPYRFGLQYALNNKADIYSRKGDLEKSLEIYQIQAEICRVTHNYHGLQYSLCSQGTIYCDKGDNQKALKLFSEHSDICKKNYKYFDSNRSSSLCGQIYYQNGDIEEAKENLLEQYRYSEVEKYIFNDWGNLLHLIFILELAEDYNTANEYRQRAIEIIKNQKPFIFLSKILWNQNIINDIEGNLDSIFYYGQNLQDVTELFGISEKDIAFIIFPTSDQALLDKILHWYEKCEHECKKIGYMMGLQHMLGCQGMIHALRKHYNTAIPLFEEQHAICKKIGYCKGESVSLSRLAKSYLAQGDLDKSATLGIEQNALCSNHGFFKGLIDSKFILGKIHAQKREYSEALRYLKDCEKDLGEQHNFLLLSQVRLYKGAVYFMEKRYGESLLCINGLQEYLQDKHCLQTINFLKLCSKIIYTKIQNGY